MKHMLYLILKEKNITCFFAVELCLFAFALLAKNMLDTLPGKILLVLTIVLSFVSFYLLFQAFASLSARMEDYVKATLLTQQIEFQNEHLLSVLQTNKDMETIREKLHDAVNEMQMDEENSSKDELINQIIDKYAKDVFVNYCANRIINAILYNKVLVMKKMRIQHTVLATVGEEVELDDFSIMAVLTNMLDNAVEACKKVSFGKKKVIVNIYQKANYLVFQIENSIDLEHPPVLKPGFSTKEDTSSHGFGLQIIHQMCQKNDGTYLYKINEVESMICCTATLRCREDQA